MTRHVTDNELHQLVDGEVDPAVREALTAHLASCQDCAARRADLDRLRARVDALPRTIAPPEDLWPALRSRIEDRKVVALAPETPEDTGAANPGNRPWWSRPGAAAAAAVVLIATTAAITTWLVVPDGPRPEPTVGIVQLPEGTPTDVVLLISDYEGLTARLAEQFAMVRDRLPPDAVATVEENLRVIDQALSELRVVLEQEPENATVAELLATAYRQKVSILEHSAEAVS